MVVAKFQLTWYLLVSLLAALAGANPAAKNVREFKILCRLLKIAEEGATKLNPDEKAKKSVHLDEAEKIADDFATVEKKLSEASTFPLNLTDAINGENYSVTEEGRREMIRRIEAAKPIAGQLKKKVEAKKDEVREEYDAAQTNFKEAIVGRELGQIEDGKYKTTLAVLKKGDQSNPSRIEVCSAKPNTAGSQAGYNLRLDLMCICAPGDQDTTRLCGFKVGTGSGSDIWTTTTVTHFNTIWKIIYDNCEGSNSSSVLDPDNIEAALAQFEGLLGAGAVGITHHRVETNYVLGHMDSGHNAGHTCDGAALTGDGKSACINYSTQQSAGTSTPALNVTWRLKMLQAKGAIERAREKALAAGRILRRMESLHAHVMNAALGPTLPEPPNSADNKPTSTGGNRTAKLQTTADAAAGQPNAEIAKTITVNPFTFLAGLVLVLAQSC